MGYGRTGMVFNIVEEESWPEDCSLRNPRENDGLKDDAGMGIGHGSADFLWKRKMSAPKNKTVRSNQNVMVLHQVQNWQNWKMQGCFMQFLHLIFVKKLQLRPLTPTRGFLRPPDPHFSADFSILNSHA